MRRHLLLGMLVGMLALLSIASLLNQNPYDTLSAAPLMAAAFGVLGGSIWVFLRSALTIARHDEPSSWALWRQATLGAITIGVLLYLQGIRSLTLTEGGLIILAICLLELFFRSEKIDARRVRG